MRIIQLGWVVLLVTMITGCGDDDQNAEQTARETLRVGTDATYPPFEMVSSETGLPTGFDIDLMSAICGARGWKTEFIVTPFDGIIPGLTSRKYDAVISAMTITPKRAAVIQFSEPYYRAGQTVAVPLEDSTTTGVDDLPGKRVGVQLGTTGELMAKEMDGLQVYSFDNIGAAFIDMSNGNLDAVLNDFPTTRAYITKHGTAKTVGDILSTEHYGIAMRQNDTLLLAQINQSLHKIRAAGIYDSLHIKWFGTPAGLEETEDSVGSTDQ